jgi:hypothetical protein
MDDIAERIGSVDHVRKASVIDAAHFQNSTLRERIVEHVFVGDALRTLWRQGIVDVEILRSEFDAHGYDLVMARGRIVRHIQFKTGTSRRPGTVSVSQSLAEKPSGCVIWIRVEPDLGMETFSGSAARRVSRCRRSPGTLIRCAPPTTRTACARRGSAIERCQAKRSANSERCLRC